MKQHPDYELLSAYLDGELSTAEQAQVEQLLTADPAAKRMIDELRMLGSTLQSLPKQKLSEELSASVLQIAAKRKANGSDASQSVSLTPSSPTVAPRVSRARVLVGKLKERIKSNPRMIAWPLIVVSVAVFLSIFNPDHPGAGRDKTDRNIAQASKDQNEDHSVFSKIHEPKAGDVADNANQPSISAVGPTKVARNPSNLVAKGNPNGGETSKQTLATGPLADLIVVKYHVSGEVLDSQEYRKVFEAHQVVLPDKSAIEILHTTTTELAAATGIDRGLLDVNPKAKVLAIEATPEQVGEIINGLSSQPETYRDVSFKMPAAAPSDVKPLSTKRVLFVFQVE